MFALVIASICLLAEQSHSQEKKAEKITGNWTSHTVKAGNDKIKMPVKETEEQIIELPSPDLGAALRALRGVG